MVITFGIVLTLIAIYGVYQNNGDWYEYLAAVVIGVFVCFGLYLL